MASHTLELTLISAQDLKDVNHFTKMEVYAVVSIAGDCRSQQCTPTDRHNGKNPAWYSTLHFSLPATGDLSSHVLHILLCSKHALGDRNVGEILIPLVELAGKGLSTFISYQVRKPSSGESMGVLNLSYKFIDSTPTNFAAYSPSATAYPPPAANYAPQKEYPAYPLTSMTEPVTVYHPAGPSTGTAYPPQGYPEATAGYGFSARPPQAWYGYPQQQQPQPAYGHLPPPQAGSAYGLPQTWYGYPQQQQPQPAYGHLPPPQAGYGYGPPQAAYGYAPAPQLPKPSMFGWMGRVLFNVVGDVVGELVASGLDGT